MDFEFTIVGRLTGAPSLDDARLQVAKAVRQLDNYSPAANVMFTDVGYDVKQYPHGSPQAEQGEGGGIRFTEMMAGGPPTVRHPWDDGEFIFPEGHPLRPTEEFARMRYHNHCNAAGGYNRPNPEKETWLELGRKELNP